MNIKLKNELIRFSIGILLLLNISFCQESYIDSTKIIDPKIAWKLGSIPGLGQIYNEKYIKAACLIGLQYYVSVNFIRYKKEKKIGKRNTYAWWIVGLWVYGMLDAYVDAQLSTFPSKASEIENNAEAADKSSSDEK